MSDSLFGRFVTLFGRYSSRSSAKKMLEYKIKLTNIKRLRKWIKNISIVQFMYEPECYELIQLMNKNEKRIYDSVIAELNRKQSELMSQKEKTCMSEKQFNSLLQGDCTSLLKILKILMIKTLIRIENE